MAEDDWDAYWVNARQASMHRVGGPRDEMLERFWVQFFRQVLSACSSPRQRILDIACGYGAVSGHALTTAGSLKPEFDLQLFGLDSSPAVLLEVRKRHPVLNCVAASAASLPVPGQVFDVVTSQFGLEYAGRGAFLEAARVVKPGGVLAAVMHKHDGSIYRECADNLRALDGIRQSNLLHSFGGIFRTAQAIQQGAAGQESFRRADREFSGSVAAVEDIFRRFGRDVAEGLLFRIYNDIAHMYQRFKGYDPADVYSWIETVHREVDTFAGRMDSMLRAALDERGLQQVTADLTDRKFNIQVQDVLHMGKTSLPAAWVLIAEKT